MPRQPEGDKPRTAAERQARYQAKLRAMSPVARALREAEETIYTAEELKILGGLRRLEDQLSAEAGRLNALVKTRLLGVSMDPNASQEERQRAAVALHELDKVWRLTLASF